MKFSSTLHPYFLANCDCFVNDYVHLIIQSILELVLLHFEAIRIDLKMMVTGILWNVWAFQTHLYSLIPSVPIEL